MNAAIMKAERKMQEAEEKAAETECRVREREEQMAKMNEEAKKRAQEREERAHQAALERLEEEEKRQREGEQALEAKSRNVADEALEAVRLAKEEVAKKIAMAVQLATEAVQEAKSASDAASTTALDQQAQRDADFRAAEEAKAEQAKAASDGVNALRAVLSQPATEDGAPSGPGATNNNIQAALNSIATALADVKAQQVTQATQLADLQTQVGQVAAATTGLSGARLAAVENGEKAPAAADSEERRQQQQTAKAQSEPQPESFQFTIAEHSQPKDLLMQLHKAGAKTAHVFRTNPGGTRASVAGALDSHGAITLEGVRYTSPLKFVRAAAQVKISRNEQVMSQLCVEMPSGASHSLDDWLHFAAPTKAPMGLIKGEAAAFVEKHKITSVADLHTTCHAGRGRVMPRYVYRVMRLDEVENWAAATIQSDTEAPTDPVSFCEKLYSHIAHGTGSKVEGRCFVSTTDDVVVAAWWSHCFVAPVARIEVDKIRDTALWDATVASQIFASNQFFGHTAAKSCEFIVASRVPAEAVTRFAPPIVSICVAHFGTVQFPEELKLGTLQPVSILGGTTQALRVVDSGGQHFVLKQGRGGKLPRTSLLAGSSSHCAAEFFTLQCYSTCGAHVPAAALYRIRIVDDDESAGFDAVTYAMLTEYVDGTPLQESAAVGKRLVQSIAWADLALGNFDVCGVGYSNLLHVRGDGASSEQVYRVDGGCNIAFSAEGKRQTQHPLDASELSAFREPASTRSNATTSKVHVLGWGRKWVTSGEARVRLLGPALTDRALAQAVQKVDITALRRQLCNWIWAQREVPALWFDMADEFLARTAALLSLVRANLDNPQSRVIFEK
eukprot:SAG31_NODE_1023_length_10298_cov_3.003530_3_plen_844_part_00